MHDVRHIACITSATRHATMPHERKSPKTSAFICFRFFSPKCQSKWNKMKMEKDTHKRDCNAIVVVLLMMYSCTVVQCTPTQIHTSPCSLKYFSPIVDSIKRWTVMNHECVCRLLSALYVVFHFLVIFMPVALLLLPLSRLIVLLLFNI